MRDPTTSPAHSLWLLGAICSGIAVLALCQGEPSEVIELVALDDVVLVSPWSQFIAAFRPMVVLAAGQSVPVLSCSPRKTHTDVEVMFNGSEALVWKGSYRLERRLAGKKEPHAGSSCSGLGNG